MKKFNNILELKKYLETEYSFKVSYEKSNVSESKYLAFDILTNDGSLYSTFVIRVSGHKRPAYEHGGLYHDHDYNIEVKSIKDIEEGFLLEKLEDLLTWADIEEEISNHMGTYKKIKERYDFLKKNYWNERLRFWDYNGN